MPRLTAKEISRLGPYGAEKSAESKEKRDAVKARKELAKAQQGTIFEKAKK